MSKYRIDRIKALPNVKTHTQTEVVGLEGDETTADGAIFRDRDTGDRTCPLRHLFLFIGADPNASWLDGCVRSTVRASCDWARCALWKARQALPLETSRPGVLAIGDVRAGSTKRVAAAVGEGSAVVAQIHSVLAPAQAEAL